MADASDGSVVRGASLLILLQVVSRAVTFLANQVLLRYMTAQLLGISAQLEVYYLTVLFFARESLRVAIQRQGSEARTDQQSKRNPASAQSVANRGTQAAVNLSYLAIALGIFVAMLFAWLYLSAVHQSTTSSTPYLTEALYTYAVAAVLELASEPAFVVMQLRLQFGVRARAEAAATFLRCVVTLSSAVWAARSGLNIGALSFALGQLTYSTSLLLAYVWHGLGLARHEGFSLLPVRIGGPDAMKTVTDQTHEDFAFSYFYRPTLHLARSMMAQSVVKHILTQGDTFLISILSTPATQGVYALANNYGGLVARLVLQPIEESSRSYFSQLLSGIDGSGSSRSDTRPAKKSAVRAKTDLQSLLRFYLIFSLIIVTIGPASAPMLLSLIAGPRWAGSGAGPCLAAFAWYIPLLAVNGVSEAFVASVATETQVHQQSAWMTAFSLAFALAGFVFLRLRQMGAVGLVLANGINMLCRIAWCGVFISRYFAQLGIDFEMSSVLPGPWAVLASVITSQVVSRFVGLDTDGQAVSAKETVLRLAKIAAFASPYLGALIMSERKVVLQIYEAIRERRARI